MRHLPTFSIVSLSVLAGLAGLGPVDADTGRVIPVQAAPSLPAQAAPSLPPVATPEKVAPAAPDDSGPLLTPEIRPRDRESSPFGAPERKAEPKAPPAPPQLKEAQPALPSRPDGKAPDGKAPDGKTPDSKPPAAEAEGKADGKTDPKAPPAQATAKPGLAVAQPRTAAERDKALLDLYAHLATADDEKQAQTISASIERLWVTPGSDTVSLLMQRAMQAANAKNPQLALKLLDAVVGLAPDYAEAWNRRAYVHYTENDIERALGDLRRTLALDPNHFKALDGLIHILTDIGRKKEALQAARRLLDVNPYYDGARKLADDLAREIEGRGI